MALSEEQKQTLELMRGDNARAGFPFAHTEYWRTEAAIFEKLFDALGINSVEGEYYNTRFHGTQPNDHRLYEWFLTIFYRHLQARDRLGLLKRLTSNLKVDPSSKGIAIDGIPLAIGHPIRLDGKDVSADLLFSIYDFYNMLELAPGLATEPLILADLGAGWGRLGYVLLHANPLAHYVVFDIPETLLISSNYLPRVCSGFSFCNYEESRSGELSRERLLSKSIWFLGAQDLARLSPNSLDLLVNVASFQEMPSTQVNRYLELIHKPALGGHVYLRNARVGAVNNNRVEEYLIPRGWAEKFHRDAAYCAGFYEAGYSVA
jgi:putative sugar O-methyltransferase